MSEFVRVLDESTGHKITVGADSVVEGLKVLDEPAVSSEGRPLAPEYAPPKVLEEQTVGELRSIAEKSGVDLTGTTKKAEIVAKITEEQK